jgi:TldD protein
MDILEKAIEYALKLGAKFVEAKYLKQKELSIKYTDGSLKSISSGEDEGISIRIFINGAWGFGASNEININSVYNLVEKAFKIAKTNSERIKEKYEIKHVKSYKAKSIIKTHINFDDVAIEEKVNLVKELDKRMFNFDKRIKSTTVNYNENQDIIYVKNSLGNEVYKEDNYLYLSTTAYSLENGIRGFGREAKGGVGGYELIEEKNMLEIGEKAAKKAAEQLKAKSVKPGKYVCILDPIIAGVFAHEGIGHPAEADAIVERNSVLEGMTGKTIASEKVTIIDNPLIDKAFGYYEYDDEGFLARPRKIIENGILKEYLNNLETASILNMELNASSRAEGYLNEPLVRMSNIYFEKGDMSFEELISETKFGIYAKGFHYGYVVPSNGQYTFKCEYGYLIEKGEVKQMIRDISLTGLILETLRKIDGLGKDLQIEGVGFCGKDGQWVRVGDGGPHIRVSEIIVGGLE